MILIADSGATKAAWCLLHKGMTRLEFTSPGINASLIGHQLLCQRLEYEVMPEISTFAGDIHYVHFYGAGCIPAVCEDVSAAIGKYIPRAQIEVASDMLGVCRALCGNESGVACILGTGANSCLYDGTNIIDNVPPLGYILGDEGSGAYLGKMLVSDVFKRQLPDDICHEFIVRYNLDAAKVVQHVYREDSPSRYLASFAPFIKEKISSPSIHNLVFEAFRAFLMRNVCAYDIDAASTPVHFCGSIAYYFKDVLIEAADSLGIVIGKVCSEPMEYLKKYHGA